MNKKLVGNAYSKNDKPNICYKCGKHPIVKTQQGVLGGVLFGLCEEHKNYSIVLGYDTKLEMNAYWVEDFSHVQQ